MDRQEFQLRADACLERVEQWLEGFDPDELDFTSADGVVKLEFATGATFVLNRQTAAHQMWFAAGASAWHYEWSEGEQAWRCDKDGHDLLTRIAEVAGERLGRAVSL